MDEQTDKSQPQVNTGMPQGVVSQPQVPVPSVKPQSASVSQSQPGIPSPTQSLSGAPSSQSSVTAPLAGQTQTASSFRYVGFGRRFVAVFIDGLILLFINGSVAVTINLLLGSSDETTALASTIAFLINTVIGYSYLVGFLTIKGATPGKMALGIKVISIDGQPVSIGRAALREIVGKMVSFLVLNLGFLWVIWDEKKQGWHDKIAGTVVVYK